MPIIDSSYQSAWYLKNKHLGTIYPTLFREVQPIQYTRKRLFTPDNDFIDIDSTSVKNKSLVLILHGLEGTSNSKYILGLVHFLNQNNLDTAVFNQRSCSGEPNNLLSSYHSGKSDDLSFIVQQIESEYKQIILVGFSLGGNITLKYLGEQAEAIHPKIQKAITISVPCDLKGSSYELKKRSNKIYMERFLKTLKSKTIEKLNRFPNSVISKSDILNCKNFFDFDGIFTGPVHGFKDAFDYWEKCSSKQFIPNIKIPTLLINAQNDPFLSTTCFPIIEANENKNFFLEMPKYGGHVGFVAPNNEYWVEKRILSFIKNNY